MLKLRSTTGRSHGRGVFQYDTGLKRPPVDQTHVATACNEVRSRGQCQPGTANFIQKLLHKEQEARSSHRSRMSQDLKFVLTVGSEGLLVTPLSVALRGVFMNGASMRRASR